MADYLSRTSATATAVHDGNSSSDVIPVSSPATTSEKVTSLYRADQQAELLDLQHQADNLLEQLRTLKRQRIANTALAPIHRQESLA